MTNLDPEKVPPELRYSIPLAEKWGTVLEGAARIDLARQTSDQELNELMRIAESADEHVLSSVQFMPDGTLVVQYEGS
jgi:hypothetical protein